MVMPPWRRARVTALACLALLVFVPAKAAWASADEVTIRIENFTFTPSSVEIRPGTRVTWENADDIPHAIVLSDGSYRSKALDTTERTSFTFTQAGSFGYFCGLHPHMTGTVVVRP